MGPIGRPILLSCQEDRGCPTAVWGQMRRRHSSVLLFRGPGGPEIRDCHSQPRTGGARGLKSTWSRGISRPLFGLVFRGLRATRGSIQGVLVSGSDGPFLGDLYFAWGTPDASAWTGFVSTRPRNCAQDSDCFHVRLYTTQ